MKAPAPSGARGEALAFVALLSVHAALCLYFAPAALLDAILPPSNDAFAVALYRVARARLAAPGAVLTYDPQVLGGQLAGLMEPFAGRALAYAVLALGKLGISPVRAVGATLIALHLGFPCVGYAAARAFGLRRPAALLTFALWSFAWFFDSLLHYSWYSGRIEWTLASGFGLAAAGLSWRVASGGAIVGGASAAAAVLGVAALFHPIPALFFAAFAVAPLALSRRGGLGPRRLGALLPALVPVAVTALFFTRGAPLSAEPMAAVYHPSLLEPLWDALEVLGPGNGAPGSARTFVRTFCFVAAFLQASAFRALGDRRGLSLALPAGAGVVIGYGGALIASSWPVDPYFFLVPAFLTATVPAALLVSGLGFSSLLRTGPLPLRVGAALAALVVVPHAYRAVATYVPELLPTRVERAALDYRVSAFVGLNEPLPEPFRHSPPPSDYAALAAFVEREASSRGRVVTDDAAFALFLATRTSVAVLGPIAQRGAASAGADPTPLLEVADERALATYLERYAAGLVVLLGPETAFDRPLSGVLEPAVLVAGARVRRVHAEPSFFAEGRGHVSVTGPGRLRVTAEPAPRVVLRFHHDGRLECRPSCALTNVPLSGAQSGFIGIERPPAEFEIVFR